MFCDLTEGRWVWLSRKEVDNPPHQLIPLLLVVFPQVLPNLIDVFVQALDATIDIALLWVCNRPELMLLLNHLGKVPQLWGPSHVLALEGVVDSLHVLESFCCTFEFLVLPLLARQHALANDGVLDVLVHCWVYVFQLLHSDLNHLVSEGLITVVFPYPITAQFFQFQLIRSLLTFFLL